MARLPFRLFTPMHRTYAPVSSNSESPSSEIDERDETYTAPKRRLTYSPWYLLAASSLLFVASVVLFILSLRREPSDMDCARRMNAYSPMMEAVEYEWVTFENTFFQESKYRGKPTPHLEKAWDELWNYGAMNVPIEHLPGLNGLNKSIDDTWRRVPPHLGGGVAGLVESFHQIHCLNLVRQYTYRDEYDYSSLPSFDGTPRLVRAHVDHCIEALRRYIMCVGDVTPYLIKVNPNRLSGEDPDFRTLHKCRKYDKLVGWIKEHAVITEVAEENREKSTFHTGHTHG